MTVDALAPASIREVIRFFGSTPGRPRPRWVAAFVLIFGVTLAAMMASASLLGYAVNAVGQPRFVYFLAAAAGALMLETLARAVGNYLLVSKARVLSVDLRRAGLRSTLQAPVPRVLELGTGNVITRLTRDIDQAVMLVQMIGLRLVVTLLVFPFTVVSIAVISPYFLILFVVAGLIMWPALRTILRVLPHTANVVSTAEARRNNLVLDTIRGLPTLQALHRGQWALQRMEQGSWDAVQAHVRRVPLFIRLMWVGQAVYGILLLGTVGFGMWLAQQSVVSVGAATAATVLIVRLEMHVFNLLFFAGEIQESLVGLGRAVALATLAPGVQGAAPAPVLKPGVQLVDVGFSYPTGAPILEGLNLTLEPGTTTALVGTSGAGKSTVAALIAGLLQPTQGTIRVGGHDTSRVPDTWLAQTVTLISQEVHLFSGTLRDDLLMAGEYGDDELLAALAQAGLDPGSAAWHRAFPRGLDTLIGAGHADVAPEVAQQVSLARVILRDPPVLIMDEATAEAGSDHARALEQAAAQVARGRTSLVVAHRLDQAVLADRVLLMEAGRIIEDGSHRDLLAAGGHYAQLFRRWSAGRRDP